MINLELVNRVGNLFRSQIAELGYELEIQSEFRDLAAIAESYKHDITPHFHPATNTFFWSEAFWIAVKHDDKVIGYCAAKRQDVGNEGLLAYNLRYWERTYGSPDAPVVFEEQQSRELAKITGKLIYSGAWYMSKDHRNSHIGKLLGQYVQCHAFAEWRDTDYFYIFMDSNDVGTGLGAALELKDQVVDALHWRECPAPAKPNYWLLGCSREWFEDWLMRKLVRHDRSAKASKE
ncbi:MAG: hypothetical protein AAF468_12410 [Pseudomonadota bacterium]